MDKSTNSVPQSMQEKYHEATSLIHSFCSKYLSSKFEMYSFKLCSELCCKEPSPLLKGRNSSWASGIIHALCEINLLFDPASEFHISEDLLPKYFGVSQSTILKKSKEIRRIMDMDYFSTEWILTDKGIENPLLWTLSINGFSMDVRKAPKEIQKEAYELGLIPFIPANKNGIHNIIDFKSIKKKNTSIISSNKEKAFDLVFKAWGDEEGQERIKLAQEALKLYPDCADAYIILAEDYAGDFAEEKVFYELAVEAGKRELGAKNFREYQGSFWSIIETRPYMRARFALANVLWGMGCKKQAISHLKEMLVLNPFDDQGIRWVLLNWLLDSGEDEDILQLLNQFKDDYFSGMLYSHALYLYKRGDFKEADGKLREALTSNPYVPSFILGHKKLPKMLPEYMGAGDENEAIVYLWDSYDLWHNIKGAYNWLKEVYEKNFTDS